MLNNFKYLNKYLLAQMRRIYFMALPENKKDFKKSRIYYTVGDSAVQTIAQLSGGTFLATLMSFCGISDAKIGIITSLVSLAAISQIFLIKYFKRIKKYKFLVCLTAFLRILFILMYFVPLLPIRDTDKATCIVILYFVGQIFVQVGTPASQDWIASLVPSRLRGKYFSIKDSVAVFVVSSTMLLAGIILDHYKTRNIMSGFIIIGGLIFILVLTNVIALSMMKEPKLSYMNQDGKEMHGRLVKRANIALEKEKENSIILEVKEAFLDQRFRKVFILQCLFFLSFYIAVPFNASYQINQLALPYTFIMLVGFIANLYRIYITPKLGRLADKHGMAKILRYTLFALGLNFLTMAFTVPGNAYPMQIIASIFGSTAWAFVGIGLFGVQLDFFKNEKRMIWLTLTSSLSGVFGFIVSLIGGGILSHLQKIALTFFGVKIYAQQVLNMIGFIVILFTVLYIKIYIETEKISSNHKDGRVTI